MGRDPGSYPNGQLEEFLLPGCSDGTTVLSLHTSCSLVSSLGVGDVPPPFELPNVGAGPDPLSLDHLVSDPDTHVIILLLQRDYHCRNCRKQVTDVTDHYNDFRNLHTTVVSILPEPVERAAEWQRSYDLPFPLVADPEASVVAEYDQPVRFGLLGQVSDFFGRMPEAVVITAKGNPRVVSLRRGRTTWDRPDATDLLEMVSDANREEFTRR